jgi:uncharacterized protein with HEPN domain
MSKRDHLLLLNDILESAIKIKIYTENLSLEDFLNDDKTVDAVVRNIEIIGEATNRINPKIKEQYPKIEWKRIKGLRNRIVHDYFGIDYEIVWSIIENDLDKLIEEIEQIINDNK